MNKKIEILENIFGQYRINHSSHGDEYLFYCPKCKHHKQKLSFNLDKNYFKCWICSWSGKSIYWAINQYGSPQEISTWNELNGNVDFASLRETERLRDPDEVKIVLPEEYESLANHSKNPSILEAKLYLKERNISFFDIVKWKIGVCTDGAYRGRIIIPSFDLRGELNYFVARSFDNHPINYKNPPAPKDLIFNELFLDWSKDIVLTEGVFDAIVAENAIPLLGSTLSEETEIFQKIISKCPKIYLALDPDAKEKEDKLIKQFLMYGVEVNKISVEPFKDVGEMSKTDFKERKLNAESVTNSNMIQYLLE